MNNKIEKLESIISIITNKESKLYFFTIDTKNIPNGEVKYIYDLALTLLRMGYNVEMLHQEDEFVGASEWLGEEYDVLIHRNVKQENVVITPSDFLFIPEVFATVMSQTKSLPCKRIMIYYSPSYLIDYMPVGITMSDLNIYDAITTNETLKERLQNYFPNMNVRVVRPFVSGSFSNDGMPKKLMVNLLTPSSSEVNDIIKPFYWKNPVYKWVSFRDIKGVSQAMMVDVLREAAITIWADDFTNNAQMALEALKSGSLLIAKIPHVIPSWMLENGELRNGIIWFDTYDMLHEILASVIRGWTRDEIVEDYLTMSDKVRNVFTQETHRLDSQKAIEGIFEDTLNTYKQILSAEKNNEKNNAE